MITTRFLGALKGRLWNHPWTWGALALGGLALQAVVGLHRLFPVVGLPPIMLAAWHGGLRAAVGFTVGVSGLHLALVSLQALPGTGLAAALSAGVDGVVLLVMALVMARVGQAHRAPRRPEPSLEGLVTICAFCKCIRDAHDRWTPLETYLSARSAATFSHGVCPECLGVHYGRGATVHGRADRGGTGPAPPSVSATW